MLTVKKFVIGPLATNCYLVWDSASQKGILIDPACHDESIDEYVRENGIDVLYILNTHGHPDHVMGNAYFGYPALIHRLDEGAISEAERLLEDGELISLGGFELKVIHTPGHSPGGVSILCDDMLFSGDTLFYEGIGRADLFGGDHEQLLKSIKEKLLTLPDNVRVYPGHGPETTIGHEKKNNPFL